MGPAAHLVLGHQCQQILEVSGGSEPIQHRHELDIAPEDTLLMHPIKRHNALEVKFSEVERPVGPPAHAQPMRQPQMRQIA
jgi:hypothetical protein